MKVLVAIVNVLKVIAEMIVQFKQIVKKVQMDNLAKTMDIHKVKQAHVIVNVIQGSVELTVKMQMPAKQGLVNNHALMEVVHRAQAIVVLVLV